MHITFLGCVPMLSKCNIYRSFRKYSFQYFSYNCEAAPTYCKESGRVTRVSGKHLPD